MATTNQKIVREIDKLKEEKARLEEELRAKAEFNRAAWQEYGSELCANEMVRNLDKIREKIAAVEKKIKLLVRYLDGCIRPQIKQSVQATILEFDRQIDSLTLQKMVSEETLKEISDLENLLKAL